MALWFLPGGGQSRGAGGGQRGFSLLEALVGSVLFAFIAVAVYSSFGKILDSIEISRIKLLGAELADEQIEIARNLPYADVGISGGLPAGKLPATQQITRSGHTFTVATVVRNIDDPFDGTIGGSPNDLSPADYKLIEVDISCAACQAFRTLTFTGRVAPKALETASTNGALFVHVIDASGQPVQDATVDILDSTASPAVHITDVTGADGWLRIIDAPPGAAAYRVTVSKTGYTGDRTYPSGAAANPNPVVPDATVAQQQVTQITLSIDKVSTLAVTSVDDACAARGSVHFELTGSKLVGTVPDVLKYDQALVTSGAGLLNIANAEWDIYTAALTDATYDLAGTIPLSPVDVLPNAVVNYSLVVMPKSPKALLVTVKDSASQLPVSDATVTLTPTSGAATTLVTGSGYRRQTDWSGGAGQDTLVDATKYFDSDGNVDTGSPVGELKLRNLAPGAYVSSGTLTSSTFDLGAAANFQRVFWTPQTQPAAAGTDPVRVQIATNTDGVTWNFLGPDGTASSYYTVNASNIASVHNGDRYLRYKVFLSTADSTVTPDVADVSFTFTSSCVPPGQSFFNGMSQSSYEMTVTKTGYQPYDQPVALPSNWQEQDVNLVAQ